jgi:hypothetical protein
MGETKANMNGFASALMSPETGSTNRHVRRRTEITAILCETV